VLVSVNSCLSDADIPYICDESEASLAKQFFGYPDDAIEFYSSSSDPVQDFADIMRQSSY
jgi:hypothetical protein